MDSASKLVYKYLTPTSKLLWHMRSAGPVPYSGIYKSIKDNGGCDVLHSKEKVKKMFQILLKEKYPRAKRTFIHKGNGKGIFIMTPWALKSHYSNSRFVCTCKHTVVIKCCCVVLNPLSGTPFSKAAWCNVTARVSPMYELTSHWPKETRIAPKSCCMG